jgi:hypothetical protein
MGSGVSACLSDRGVAGLISQMFRASEMSGDGQLETVELYMPFRALFPKLDRTELTELLEELDWHEREIEGSGVTEEECAHRTSHHLACSAQNKMAEARAHPDIKPFRTSHIRIRIILTHDNHHNDHDRSDLTPASAHQVESNHHPPTPHAGWR